MPASAAAPPSVLDLIWHAHQTNPVQYKEECFSLFGCEFSHHPWPNGLGQTTPLSDEFQCAWKQAYGSTIDEDWQLYILDRGRLDLLNEFLQRVGDEDGSIGSIGEYF